MVALLCSFAQAKEDNCGAKAAKCAMLEAMAASASTSSSSSSSAAATPAASSSSKTAATTTCTSTSASASSNGLPKVTFRTPRGCALPYGVMEAALAAQPGAAERHRALLAAAEGAGLESLDAVCAELQGLVKGLTLPEELIKLVSLTLRLSWAECGGVMCYTVLYGRGGRRERGSYREREACVARVCVPHISCVRPAHA